MNATLINTAKELKDFVKKNRKGITNINGIQFGEVYPILEVSNRNAFYYDVNAQESKLLLAPFKIEIKK